MAKILHLPHKEKEPSTAIEFLEDAVNTINDDVESVIVAFKDKDGNWMTGYFKADWGTRNEALGHIQADIIDQMILSNIERYGG